MKKGFTLIEMLACIGLMAMLATILITISVKKVNETKEKSRDTLIKSIELSAINYVTENLDTLSDFKNNDWINVSLKTLVENNKLTSNLYDQTTKKNIPLTDTIYVTKSYNGKITASYDIDQNTKSVISLNGSYNIYLDKGETYTELGATALSSSGTNITSNIVTTGIVNTNVNGYYQITYSLGDISIKRNIIVGNL